MLYRCFGEQWSNDSQHAAVLGSNPGRIMQIIYKQVWGEEAELNTTGTGDGIAQRMRSRFPPSCPGFDSQRRLVSGQQINRQWDRTKKKHLNTL